MIPAEVFLDQAGELADKEIKKSIRTGTLSINFSTETIERIENLIAKAVEAEPENAEYLYLQAASMIDKGLGKSGLEKMREIADRYPDFEEAQGCVQFPDRWLSSLYYPSWHEDQKTLPTELARLPEGGMSIVPLRDGIRRVMGFFQHIDSTKLPGKLSQKIPADVKFNIMDTPYGLVTGVYVVLDFGKDEKTVNETILNVDTCPENFHDMSVAGYWIMRILSCHKYVYVIMNDCVTGNVFHKKVYIKGPQQKELAEIRSRLSSMTPIVQFDKNKFLKAQQYYMQNFSLDNIV